MTDDNDTAEGPTEGPTGPTAYTTYEDMGADDPAQLEPFTAEMVATLEEPTSSLAFIIAEDHRAGFMIGAGEDGETVHLAMCAIEKGDTEPTVIQCGVELRAAAELSRAINRAGRETIHNGMRASLDAIIAGGGVDGVLELVKMLVGNGTDVTVIGIPVDDMPAGAAAEEHPDPAA